MSEWRECCIVRALWRVHQKVILCKVFSSVQLFFDVLNNKFDIAMKFFLNLGYTHILKRKKTAVILRIYFERGLIACHIPDRWSRVQIGFDQISPSRIDNDKLYRATFRSPGDDVYLAREGCWDIMNSQTAWVRVGSSLFLKWRPSGLVKIGKIEGILTSEQTPLWYRWK